ncbi:30S ribosomal protein S4e [Candidatus Woesearchaeota archaeon]|nr:30S ribosomal protein S4e [Candidatus Woesearchaeota archaeon]
MVRNHLMAIAAPKNWMVKRKETQFVLKTNCGPYSLDQSMPLGFVLREKLKYAKTRTEIKRILNQGKIIVNKKVRKELKFPVGFMDVIECPAIKEQHRILFDRKGRFMLHPIGAEEANLKLLKITGKSLIRGKKLQLNFYDGTNLLVQKDTFKVGDSVLMDLTKKQLKDHLKFEKGAVIYLIGGKKIAEIGHLQEVKQFKGSKEDNVLLKTKDGVIETAKAYAFVIGKEKSAVSLPE